MLEKNKHVIYLPRSVRIGKNCALGHAIFSVLKNPHFEWIHQIKSKSGFLGFMIRAFLWGTDGRAEKPLIG